MPPPSRDDIAGGGVGGGPDLLAILAHSPLFSQPPRVTAAVGDTCSDEQADDVSRSLDSVFLLLIRDLLTHELAYEMCFGVRGRLLPMQSLDQLPGQRCLGVARLHPEHCFELFAFEA